MSPCSRTLVSTLFLVLSISSVAWGQAQLTTAIAPARVEKLVNPGTRVEDVISYTNPGDVPVAVSLSLVDFDVTETGEVLELPPGTGSHTIVPYLRISPVQTTVAPRERASFRFSVETPEDFDQLRAFVYFESEPLVTGASSKQVLFATAMGIPLYVENRKATRGALRVHEVAWERDGENPEALVLRLFVTNDGARNIRPGGFVTVRSEDDAYAETFEFNPNTEVVLPGHDRRLTFRFGPVPPEALEVNLRFEVSMRSSHQSTHRIPKAGG